MEVLIGLFGIALVLTPLILAIVNFSRVSALIRRVQLLEFSTMELRKEVENAGKRTPPVEAPPSSAEETKKAPTSAKSPRVEPKTTESPVIAQTPTQSWPPFSQPSIPRKAKSNKEWEALIGGKVLNRVGALALVIGVGFFLKYAIDNEWITETMRVVMGGVFGAFLLIAANRFHKKEMKVFAQGLVGAGIAILYLSVYAAFNFYQLIPQWVAFLLMAGVTMVTFLQAVRYDAIAVALLGWAGGFLTPFMLRTEVTNEVGLFTYLALLSAALVAIVLYKTRWLVLEVLTMGAAYLIFFVWFAKSYNATAFVPSLFYLTVLWGLFVGVEAFRLLRGASEQLALRTIGTIVNGALAFVGMYAIFTSDASHLTGLVTLLLALPYAALVWRMLKGGASTQFLLGVYFAGAVALIVTATAIQFYGMTTATVWALEAALIVLIAHQFKVKAAWISAAAVILLATFKLVVTEGSLVFQPLEEFRLLFNMRALSFVVLGLSTYFFYERSKGVDGTIVTQLHHLVGVVACFVWFLFFSVETYDWFERHLLYVSGPDQNRIAFHQDLTLGVIWMTYAVVLLWLAGLTNLRVPVYASVLSLALGLVLLIIRGSAYDPLQQYALLANYRVAAFVVGTLVVVGYIRVLRSDLIRISWKSGLVGAGGIAVFVLIFALLTSETFDYFEHQIFRLDLQAAEGRVEGYNEQWRSLGNLQSLSISLVWLLYSVVLMAVGIWRRTRAVRVMAIVLFGVTILKIFIYDLSFLQTLYRIISFMGLGVILLAVSFLYQKYKHVILGGNDADEETTNSS